LYYLQSRYYNPTLGRFINTDALVSTGQGLLGSNVFTYCLNNPVCLYDPEGARPIGFGLQFDVSAGEETVGVEIVVYYDPIVSGGDGPDVVYYIYSGSELSSENLTFMEDMLGALASITAIEAGSFSTDSILFAAKAFLEGANFSGSFFLIDGNDNFEKSDDYSGAFETWSFTGTFMGKQAGMYYSYSSTCCTVGIKVGINLKPGLLPVNISYSRTEYSKAHTLF